MLKRSVMFFAVCAGFFFFLFPHSAFAAPEILGVSTTFFASSAKVTWTATDPLDLYGANFEFGPTRYLGQTTTAHSAISITASGINYIFSSNLSNVSPQSEIFYKITVFNSAGESDSYEGSFVAPAKDTRAPVISRISVAAQSESATVSWVTDEPSDSRVVYSIDGDIKTKSMSPLVTDHYVYIGDLKSNTSYSYHIESVDQDGNTTVSSEKRFNTIGLLLPPNDVSGLRAEVKDGRIYLTWHNPSQKDFDHVTVVRSPGAPAVAPDDGEKVYQGIAESFNGPLPKAKYYYTVFSFNNLGKNSGGTTVEVASGVISADAPPRVTVSSTQHLLLSSLQFYTDRRERRLAPVNGTVTDRAKASFSIALPASLLPYPPQVILVNISGGELHQFSQPSGQNNYFTDFAFPTGKKDAFVEITYANGLVDVIQFHLESQGEVIEAPWKPPLPAAVITTPPPEPKKETAAVIAPIKETAEAIKEFAANVEVQEAVSNVVAPTIVGVAAVTTVTTVSWVNLLPFLQLILFQPVVLMGRRRRFSYGQVYDALSKLPVDLAVVRLINKATGTLAQSKVTDKEGRYAFVVNPGTYTIQVIKNGFLFPSRLMRETKMDGQKVDLYHGEALVISGSDAVVAANIPLDPAGQYHKPPTRLLWQNVLRRVQIIFSWVGLVVIIFSLYVSPKWYTAVLLGVHLFSLLILRRLASPRKQKNWGVVYDAKTRKPIQKAIARLYNAHLNRLVASQITDAKGRYFFLAGDDTYYLTFEHPGYSAGRTDPINLKGKKAESIAMDFGLKPGVAA